MGRISHWILIFLIAGAVFLSAFIGLHRYSLENNYKTIETVISLENVRGLALKEGSSEGELLKKLKTNGISSIAIQEDSIETLMFWGNIAFWNNSETAKLNGQYQDYFKDNKIIIHGKSLLICRDYSLFERIRGYLQNFFGLKQVQELLLPEDQFGLLITANPEELLKLGLGFSMEDIRMIQSLDFNIILRPKNSPKVLSEVIEHKLAAIKQAGKVSMIIFDEEEVLGYPSTGHLISTANFLRQNHYPFGIIEFASQKGIDTIASQVSELSVRVHSITKEEMEKITLNKAIERWVRAAQERNIRLFYLNPFLNYREGSLIDFNLTYFNNIKKELEQNGFTVGRASLFPEYQSPLLFLGIIGMGIIAAGIILLKEFFDFQDKYIFLLIFMGFFFLILINFIMGKIWLIKILALTAALVFPVLAIIKAKKHLLVSPSLPAQKESGSIHGNNNFNTITWHIVVGISTIAGLSLTGGLLTGALLTHYQFILAIRLFSGIKIAYILPLLLIALYLWWKDCQEKVTIIEELKKPVLFEHALLVFILFVFLVIYISRSGNFSFLPVPGLEEKMRLSLEKILVARPRSKEFLIGYPLLALAITMNDMGITYLKYLIIIMGSVAPVTVLNTFCHVHTPLCFSLLRTFHGFWLGLLLGLVVAAIFYFSIKIFRIRINEKRE